MDKDAQLASVSLIEIPTHLVEDQTKFMMMLDLSGQLLYGLEDHLPKLNITCLDNPLEVLIDLKSKSERFTEIFDLVQRTRLAITEGTSNKREIKQDTLKAIDFILKSNRKRPEWTFRVY